MVSRPLRPRRTRIAHCSNLVFVLVGPPVDRDTPRQAVGEDVVGPQGHEHEIVLGIGGHGVRVRGGMLGAVVPRPHRWHIKRRHQLIQAVAKRVDHAEHAGTLGRSREGGAQRAPAAGGVVVTVASVEPDFVPSTHAKHGRFDDAGFRVEDHVPRVCGNILRRIPYIARRIENRIAADKQILIGTESETGRAAIIDHGRYLERGRVRIDPIDRSCRARGRRRSGYRWDREIEPAVVRVPHGLFGSTGGGSESNPLPDSSGRLIDADEGSKRHRIRVVDHQEQPELRGVRQFIGPVGIIGRRNDVSPWCNLPGPQVNIDHPASTVSHEEPGECGYDSVGTATIAAAGGSTDGSGHDSGERRANGNLRDKCRRLGVDDVNGHIRTIGEVVGLGRLVDETDIKGVQLAIRGIRGGPGDRNRLEQSDGAIIILSPSGQRKVAGQQHTRGDRHRQSREPEIFPEYAEDTVLLKAHKKTCEIFHNPSSFRNSLICFKKPVCGKCSSVA